jgi:hypothetical protein
MKISLTPHKHILLLPRADFRYKPRSFLTLIARVEAPRFFTADHRSSSIPPTTDHTYPPTLHTTLSHLWTLLTYYTPFTTFLCTAREIRECKDMRTASARVVLVNNTG